MCSMSMQIPTPIVLVAPVWKAQAWYSMLLQMLVRAPIHIPQAPFRTHVHPIREVKRATKWQNDANSDTLVLTLT